LYFVVSAGGTAGHINPALAVADELRRRGHRILFVGTPDHIESKLAIQANFDFIGLEVAGFDRAHPLTLITSGTKILKATRKVKDLFAKERPDAVLTFGAYVSIPVGRAAFEMGIPLICHEQNSVPGMANSYLAKHADIMALTYEESASKLECKNPPVVIAIPCARRSRPAAVPRGARCWTCRKTRSCCSSLAGASARSTSTRPSAP
jgi:UDP-N-acetylglucosamine--N-acetylmuramyl-(pentapeptide) pyrophosphoryl-undecaprenol N-acetylglucosamine transferase